MGRYVPFSVNSRTDDNKLTFRFIRLWDQPDDTAKSVVVKTELRRTVEERSMTSEQTSGDDDKVESEFHWLYLIYRNE
jgi:hypothetical protein